jgi:hypothetical protein
MQMPVLTSPRRVSVLDADGRPLAAAITCAEADPEVLFLVDVDSQALLLNYYFGRGERAVMLEVDGAIIHGSLGTSWGGNERRWSVEVPSAEPTLTPARLAHSHHG